MLVLLTSLLAVVANVQRHEAVIQTQAAIRERDAAISGQLIAESEALGDTNPVLAKQESVAAWQIDPSNPAARYAMLVAARLPGTGILTSGDGASVDSVAYSPDGKILATGSGDGIVRLWDVATQQQIGVPLGNFRLANLIESVAFSPDGKIVAAASQDGVIRLWDVATHQLIGIPLTGGVSTIYSIAFSPDGDLLAAGRSDGTVQLWHVASGQQAGAPLAPHAGEVLSVAFSPDGTTLATDSYSASGRSTVQLWDVNSRQPIGGPLPEQALASSVVGSLTVYSVAFQPGRRDAGGWRQRRGRAVVECDQSRWDRLVGHGRHRHDHVGGLQPGRPVPGRRRLRRHGRVVGHGHPAADRHSAARGQQGDRVGGVQPGREDPGHRQQGRHGPAMGRRPGRQ